MTSANTHTPLSDGHICSDCFDNTQNDTEEENPAHYFCSRCQTYHLSAEAQKLIDDNFWELISND